MFNYKLFSLLVTNIAIIPAWAYSIHYWHKSEKWACLRYPIPTISYMLLFCFSTIYHYLDEIERNEYYHIFQNLDFAFSYYAVAISIIQFFGTYDWLENSALLYNLGILITQVMCLIAQCLIVFVFEKTHSFYYEMIPSFVVLAVVLCFIPRFFQLYGIGGILYHFDLIDFLAMIVCAIIGIIGQYVLTGEYWWRHSFLWHIFIMLSAMFAICAQDRKTVLLFFRNPHQLEQIP